MILNWQFSGKCNAISSSDHNVREYTLAFIERNKVVKRRETSLGKSGISISMSIFYFALYGRLKAVHSLKLMPQGVGAASTIENPTRVPLVLFVRVSACF